MTRRTVATVVVLTAVLGIGGCASARTAGDLGACRDALDKADRVIALDDEAFTYAADAMDAVGSFDAAGIRASTVKIDAIAPTKQSALAKYRTLAAACRAR